jgi:hypothetical protein
MEFKWSVNKVTVAEDNLVVKVYCTVTATDGNETACASYICDLVRGDSFIPFDQLTEAQVLAWCFEPVVTNWVHMGNEYSSTRLIKDEGEAQVTDQISRRLTQKVTEPALPWAIVAQPE